MTSSNQMGCLGSWSSPYWLPIFSLFQGPVSKVLYGIGTDWKVHYRTVLILRDQFRSLLRLSLPAFSTTLDLAEAWRPNVGVLACLLRQSSDATPCPVDASIRVPVGSEEDIRSSASTVQKARSSR